MHRTEPNFELSREFAEIWRPVVARSPAHVSPQFSGTIVLGEQGVRILLYLLRTPKFLA